MDTRTLIAFAMLLSLVLAGMLKGTMEGTDVKEIVIFLSGGVVGVTVPRRQPAEAVKPGATPPPAVVLALLAGSVLLLVSCG